VSSPLLDPRSATAPRRRSCPGRIPRTLQQRSCGTCRDAWWNERAIETTCPGSPDENCSGNTRLEILIGVDVSNNVTVNVPNSIDYRLTRLIVYLDGKHRRN